MVLDGTLEAPGIGLPDDRDGASKVRCSSRFGEASARRSEHDGVNTVGSPLQSRFDIGDGSLTRYGCPSLKTKTLDCTRRPEHAAQHRCTRGESFGNGMECGMSIRIH